MAASHGTQGVLKVSSGGSLRDISSYVKTTGLALEIADADVTGLGDTTHRYITGLTDGSIPVEGLFDPTVDGYLYAIHNTGPGFGGTAFEFYPGGTATGQVKYSGTVICTKYEVETNIDDANQIKGELKVSGAVTRAVI